MKETGDKKHEPIINIGRIWAAIVRRKMAYLKVIPSVIMVVWVITLGIPDYYNCKIQLSPEANGTGGSGALASLASSFGMNVGGQQGLDALTPMLYPDLLNSVDFKTSLFDIKVQRRQDKTPMTYYEYLRDEQKEPWWISARKGIMETLFGKPEQKQSQSVNPFELTPEQTYISSIINQKVVCSINTSISKKSTLITIDITDQDPYVAATMADSVKVHLQEFITEYRTKKARHDLEFTEKLYREAKRNYERSRQLYADYMDANHDVVLENVRQKQTELENEMQLLYNHYNTISSQLLAARVKVQEDTPAFMTLQSATVPLLKAGPQRGRIIIVFVIAALFFTTIWALFKENEIKPLLGMS